MNPQETLQQVFEHAIRQAVGALKTRFAGEAVTDLFLFPNPEAGEFTVYNDEHEQLATVRVEQWTGDEKDDENELKQAETALREVIAKLVAENIFEGIELQQPFSVLMVDDDMETLAELYFQDDDNVSLDENLLKEVDADLEDFFRKLMSDLS
ncbi:MAG: hypothetical protein IJR64_02950 [Bacteroidales bacterium]|nr:hypothetical protein [Bacteroidales bacterium]